MESALVGSDEVGQRAERLGIGRERRLVLAHLRGDAVELLVETGDIGCDLAEELAERCDRPLAEDLDRVRLGLEVP